MRHTKLRRDWSSDVCSSDLQIGVGAIRIGVGAIRIGAGAIRIAPTPIRIAPTDRKSVVEGKSGDLGGGRIIKKKNI